MENISKRYSGLVAKLGTIPHCDARVLHAPGECEYCDQRPDLQAARVLWGIGFTGRSDDVRNGMVRDADGNFAIGEVPVIPCPSEWDRPVEIINQWGGNRPYPKEGK